MREPDTKRLATMLACALALAPANLDAQERTEGWSVAVSATLAGFHGAAVDPAAPDDVGLRPEGGIAGGVTLTRQWGSWGVSVGANYLPTHVEAVSGNVSVRDRTIDFERVRFTLLAARRVARVGDGRLEVRAGPTVDNWSADGSDDRTVIGVDAAVALRLPAGPVMIENAIGLGWSSGPFREGELPAGYRRESLRAVGASIGIVFEL